MSRRVIGWRAAVLAAAALLACAQTGVAQEPAAFVEAQRAEARGDYKRAESLYDHVVAREPANTTALMGRARMRSWLGDLPGAIEDYRTVVEREPGNTAARSGLAWAHAWHRDFDAARTVFGELARAEPYYLDAQKGLAYVELWSGNAREARHQFEKLASEDKGNPDYVLAIAQAAYLEGDLPAARTAFRNALELKPDLEAARSGLQAVEAAAVERRPALTVLFGRSESGDFENSGMRFAQLALQRTRNLRLWITHDRGVGFDGFSTDRRARDSATTTVGGFYNYTPRLGARLEVGVRDLVDETQPVFSAEQVFFLSGGTTPKVGVWLADGDEATQWVMNAGVHHWLGDRLALEPTVYVGDDGEGREYRGAVLGTYTTPRQLQFGLGVALGQKESSSGDRNVDRVFGHASIPIGNKVKFLFYGWRESTEGFDSQLVLAAGATVHL